MKFDAFTEGIEPGGLRTKDEIRILICYLLASVNAPLAKEDLAGIIVENGLANYFEIMDAIAEMVQKKIISFSGEKQDVCSASDSARLIAKQLDSELPPSVRRKALCAAVRLLDKAKREKENKVEIIPEKHGYQVRCHISGGSFDLMNFSLYVPDLAQANLVKENFYRSPEIVYRMLLSLVTGDREVAAQILQDADSNK